MYTRCPGCHTVHPVNAPLLAQGAGKYRCGKCQQVNTALESLFDEWPDPGDLPPVAGKMPELVFALDLEAAQQARLAPTAAALIAAQESGEDSGTQRNKNMLRATWITTAIVLVILVTVYLVEFFQPVLPNFSAVRDRLLETGQKKQLDPAAVRHLDQIQLLNRDLRSHPTRPDALSLSLTIVNRAPLPQPYPRLQVILLDAGGQALISHLFKPDEYLVQGADIESGMTPQAFLHINLDLADPGHQAVGFELNFQ